MRRLECRCNINPLLGDKVGSLTIGDMREVSSADYSICQFERLAAKLEAERGLQTQDLRHYHGDRVYVRELRVRRGQLVIGEIHKFKHISIMLSGKMLMWTSVHGVSVVRGPLVSITPAGCKRVGFALEDTIFLTAHGVPDFGDIEPGDAQMRELLAAKTLVDYHHFLKESECAKSSNNQ